MIWKRRSSTQHDHHFELIYSQSNSYSQKKQYKANANKDRNLASNKNTLHSLGVEIPGLESSSKLKKINSFYMSKGNNHTLLRNIFEHHGLAETISKEEASIIWAQWSQQVPRIPSNCLAINFLENHQSLTNKERLFRNLYRHNKGQNENGKYLPDTYIIDFKSGENDAGLGHFLSRYFAPKEMRLKLRRLQ